MRGQSQSFKQRKSEAKAMRGSSRRRSHSKSKTPGPSRPSSPAPTEDGAGFLAAWRNLLGAIQLPSVPRRRGRKPRVPLAEVLAALVFHAMNATSTLAEHFAMLFEDGLCDSACSDRRVRLPWQIFADLMRRVLRPLARTGESAGYMTPGAPAPSPALARPLAAVIYPGVR